MELINIVGFFFISLCAEVRRLSMIGILLATLWLYTNWRVDYYFGADIQFIGLEAIRNDLNRFRIYHRLTAFVGKYAQSFAAGLIFVNI